MKRKMQPIKWGTAASRMPAGNEKCEPEEKREHDNRDGDMKTNSL